MKLNPQPSKASFRLQSGVSPVVESEATEGLGVDGVPLSLDGGDSVLASDSVEEASFLSNFFQYSL